MIVTGDAVGGTQTHSALAVLANALEGASVPPGLRVCAGRDAHAPEEGLALLSAYVTIAPAAVRQAILDVVVLLASRSVRTGH